MAVDCHWIWIIRPVTLPDKKDSQRMFRTYAEIAQAHSTSDCGYRFVVCVCVCMLATVAMVRAPLNGRVLRPVLNSGSSYQIDKGTAPVGNSMAV